MSSRPEFLFPGGWSGQWSQDSIRAEVQKRQAVAVEAQRKAADNLLGRQSPEGYWCGNLTADTTLESDYVLLELWLHPPSGGTWALAGTERIQRAARSILDRQQASGGWSIYEGGPPQVDATARAYIALKLAGADVNSAAMRKARERVLALGGLQACNSYTKINLSLFGLYPRRYAPSVPPEIMLVPGNVLYEMSSWTRAIIVPLSIVQSLAGTRPVPAGFDVEELLVPGKPLQLPRRDKFSSLFLQADRIVKIWERRGLSDIRRNAIRLAEEWMLTRFRFSDGLGAIYPSIMYSIMAMDVLGYERDQPDMMEAIGHFERLILTTDGQFQFQPCVSPVWDTAIASFALGQSDLGDPAALSKAADWLLTKEIRRKGDWSVKRPDLRPGGWAFEFANEYYPDIDDTAMVLLALESARATDPEKQRRAEQRAIDWLIGMQSSDGGWAAFDVDNNWQLLNRVPFADHNAMLDPTCPDITGRVLEALCRRGMRHTDPPVVRGIDYLLRTQREDGSWFGRWGVNYVYGTFLALRGLKASGDMRVQPAMERGMNFIRERQNGDGGWGESCASYVEHRFVPAASTASQTAWAILGLLAGGDRTSRSVVRGVQFLVETQKADGSWNEPHTTGTGFPGVFYLRYHLYAQYFPLLALALYNAKAPESARAHA